ncbi:MAG TPA: hypothetical protein VNL69_08945 [Bacteroidota bacterium]|nr:hypothetical protein [Bacteroidota bacterium]
MIVRHLSWTIALVALLGFSCKDIGHTPGIPPLVASALSVTLNPGEQTTVTISGGNPPYSISEHPDSQLATASLTNNADGTGSLLIRAASGAVSGTTRVKVKDTDTHGSSLDSPLHEENEIEIEIRVTATGTVLFSSQIQPIFTNNCVNAGCHPGGGAPFSLASGASYGNLVNQAATAGVCQGQPRVQPGSPDSSVLVKRLEGSTCGNRMPLGGSQLPAASIQLIRDWITQGALNN